MSQTKILLIDDDEDILEIEGALLTNMGYAIFSADSIESALDLIKDEDPELILLDLVFPEDTEYGLKGARTLKEKHPEIPIFLVTSINREYLAGFGIANSDFDEILPKPINVDRLVTLIAEHKLF
ncbi:MAG: response regulator [Spirochaetales bacterium]|nr:response regulator [Spirochaetales bacterium]